KFEGWPFEVQIRSILQHAWAEIEHDIGYKSPRALSYPTRRSFARLASLLELADIEFTRLRAEVRADEERDRHARAAAEQERRHGAADEARAQFDLFWDGVFFENR